MIESTARDHRIDVKRRRIHVTSCVSLTGYQNAKWEITAGLPTLQTIHRAVHSFAAFTQRPERHILTVSSRLMAIES